MRTGLLAVPLLMAAASGEAQSTTTMLTGTVRDASRAALSGAQITARHLETMLLRTSSTRADGGYVLAALPVGAHEIRVELAGFRPLVRRGVRLAVGEPAVVDFTL